ncbi:hypothetical protein EKO04_010137 [Ascochyta lentis]|uniref:DUF7730 domain-containing protein n=1 Tax=Ascochyta lentis TaxID=205686 RepID=A0A8H7MEH2_9PLEO|nr:hypothetical protein EKO04_010137 [Ascochyta lentis]
MAKPNQIPKTTSSPADASAPSFLTTIPPEVRNAIYAVLFKRDKPVLLHNAKAYLPKRPKRSDHTNDVTYPRCLEWYNEVFEQLLENGREFKLGFGCGLSVLLSCRQMYHECAGVLYGSNTFIISQALHDYSLRYFPQHEKAYLQHEYAPLWLRSVGSQIDLLHEVYIDVDAVRTLDYYESATTFNILPIMRIIWEYPGLTNKIKFYHTGRQLEGHTEFTDAREAEAESKQKANVLNNLLELLCNQDFLRLKRYLSFDRLLKSVRIPTSPEQGFVSDVLVRFANVAPRRRYHITNSGRTITATELRPNHGFECLIPYRPLLEKIFGYAAHSQSGVVFDLTRKTVSGLDLGILQLNTRIRYIMAGIIARANHVTLKARSTSVESDFDHFSALEELSPRSELGLIVYADREAVSPLTVELAFDVSVNTSLAELNISVEMLMGLLSQRPYTALRISLKCPRSQHTYSEHITVDIVRLCLNTFLLLCSLLDKWPLPLDMKGSARLLKLTIDGQGVLKSATCCTDDGSDGFTLANEHGHLSKEEMRYRGYGIKAYHERTHVDEELRALGYKNGHLDDILMDLCHRYWAD